MLRLSSSSRPQIPIAAFPALGFRRLLSKSLDSTLFENLVRHYEEAVNLTPPKPSDPPSPFKKVYRLIPAITRTYGKESIDIRVLGLLDTSMVNSNFRDAFLTRFKSTDPYSPSLNSFPPPFLRVDPIHASGFKSETRLLDKKDLVGHYCDQTIDKLFIHVSIHKYNHDVSLNVLCALYPDAIAVHSVSIESSEICASKLLDLDDNTREIFRAFVVERNINHTLFRYLLDWLYAKEQKYLFLYYKALSLSFQDFTCNQDFGYIINNVLGKEFFNHDDDEPLGNHPEESEGLPLKVLSDLETKQVPHLLEVQNDEMEAIQEARAGEIVAVHDVINAPGDTFTDGSVISTKASIDVSELVSRDSGVQVSKV